MIAVITRVKSASVTIGGETRAYIGRGFLVLLGVVPGDRESEAEYLAGKVTGLRVFEDEAGKMNLSLDDVKGAMIVVSNFTLAADCSHGRRPSFTGAAGPEVAEPLYEKFVELCRAGDREVQTGVFGADMAVSSINDGPVTIIMDTEKMMKRNR